MPLISPLMPVPLYTLSKIKHLKKQETRQSPTNHASLVVQSCTVHLAKKKLEEAKTVTAEFDKKIAEFKSLK